ncbi:MAG: hypothetical protein ACK4OF_06650 [Aquificaceae bacterium]
MDYDDEWKEDYVESSVEYLRDYHIVYSPPRTFIDEESKVIKVSKKEIATETAKLVFSGCIGYPSSSAFRRDGFLGYREDLINRGDWEIYLRSYLSGLRIKVLDNNKVRIREHGKRSSKNLPMLFDTMKIYEEYIDKIPPNYRKDFLFHVAEMNLRFGNLPLGWKFFFKSLSLSILSNPRNLLSLIKRGFRVDRYFHYLRTT